MFDFYFDKKCRRDEMKILTPIMSSDDIDILNPTVYGTEFFCGYLPGWWNERFCSREDSQVLSTPINNRNGKGANVTDIDDLNVIWNILFDFRSIQRRW